MDMTRLGALIVATLVTIFLVAGAALGANAMLHQALAEDAPPPPSPSSSRDFYQVLDDVLSDFEYDLKNGNVGGLKDLSIRNIATSENVPPSFKSHLELLITERILKTTKTRVIQCLACRSRKTVLSGSQVEISSPENNPVELARIAKENGIENFMDVDFAYQPNGMILSLSITDPQSGAVVWTRSYNSETSRAAAFRRGVDYSQIDDARKQTEYVPTIQYRLSVMYMSEPDLGSREGVLGLGFRSVERYDNRKKEVGFELDYLKNATTFAGGATGSNDIYNGFNMTLLFVHAWNLIGDEENYNHARGSLLLGVGGTYAAGYLGGLIRAQYEWRLGKHYAVTPTLGYRPNATQFIGSAPQGTISGIEAGLGVSLLF